MQHPRIVKFTRPSGYEAIADLHGISFSENQHGLTIYSIDVEAFADHHPGVEPTFAEAEEILHRLSDTQEMTDALAQAEREALQDRRDDIASGGARLLGELRKLHTQMEEAWRDSINREQCPSRSGCPALPTSLQATAAAQWLAKATSETVTAYTDDPTDSGLFVLAQSDVDQAWRLMTGQAPRPEPHPHTTAGRLRIFVSILDDLRRLVVSQQCDANLEGREDVGNLIYNAHQAMSVALGSLRRASESAGRDCA